jgi:hypothetical protein
MDCFIGFSICSLIVAAVWSAMYIIKNGKDNKK